RQILGRIDPRSIDRPNRITALQSSLGCRSTSINAQHDRRRRIALIHVNTQEGGILIVVSRSITGGVLASIAGRVVTSIRTIAAVATIATIVRTVAVAITKGTETSQR